MGNGPLVVRQSFHGLARKFNGLIQLPAVGKIFGQVGVGIAAWFKLNHPAIALQRLRKVSVGFVDEPKVVMKFKNVRMNFHGALQQRERLVKSFGLAKNHAQIKNSVAMIGLSFQDQLVNFFSARNVALRL